MRFSGRIFKVGRFWTVKIPILGIVVQSPTKRDAYHRLAETIESLVDKVGFKIDVYPGRGAYFEVGSSDVAALGALLLRRQRMQHGYSLAEVAERLGSASLNTYARYEQGQSVPSIQKFFQLLAAVSPDQVFILLECREQ